MLTETQMLTLERKKQDDELCGTKVLIPAILAAKTRSVWIPSRELGTLTNRALLIHTAK